MANLKISDLELRPTVDGDCNIPVDDGFRTYRVTAEQFKAYIKSSLNYCVDTAFVSDTPKEVTVPEGMDAQKCVVTVRDPANDYEVVLMPYKSANTNTITLYPGVIVDGTFRVLIQEVS